MAIPKIPTKIIILCIIFSIIGALWGSHAAGLINLSPFLANLPVIGDYFQTEDDTDVIISPLEEENESLKTTIKEMQGKILDFEAKESKFEEEKIKYQNEISQLESQITKLINEEENLTKIIELYNRMKPKEIASIFENLDDEKVVKILTRLETDQAAKILAELDPLRAAKLSNLFTDNY